MFCARAIIGFLKCLGGIYVEYQSELCAFSLGGYYYIFTRFNKLFKDKRRWKKVKEL